MKRLKLASILLFPVVMLVFWVYWGTTLRRDMVKDAGKKSTADRLEQYGPAARARLQPFFAAAGIAYPPARVVVAGLKQEKVLEVYARGTNQAPAFVRSYPILAASGKPGPKLREGDEQVPEGVYPVEFLNPNSKFHLALRLGYPNDLDRAQAAKEGRENLGGDIMIHGSSISVGCLAMGDPAPHGLATAIATKIANTAPARASRRDSLRLRTSASATPSMITASASVAAGRSNGPFMRPR